MAWGPDVGALRWIDVAALQEVLLREETLDGGVVVAEHEIL
jgi:hypothetical protein